MKNTNFRLSDLDKLMLVIVLFIFGAVLQSCAGEGSGEMAPPPNVSECVAVSADTCRFIDYDANVMCWKYWEFNGGGISCLPLSQVNAE